MKLLYVSGPMSGIKDLNFPAFIAAAEALRRAGYAVVNPVDLNQDPKAEWKACMRADIKVLVDCDAVATLPGWEQSRGASLEVVIATGLGMQVERAVDWLALARGA
jgi:hypothetical protein